MSYVNISENKIKKSNISCSYKVVAIIEKNKGVRFSLGLIDIQSKYAQVVLLKRKKDERIGAIGKRVRRVMKSNRKL